MRQLLARGGRALMVAGLTRESSMLLAKGHTTDSYRQTLNLLLDFMDPRQSGGVVKRQSL